jgi:septum formation protein
MAPPDIILASSSTYRRTLLERLGVPFQVRNPQVDETPNSREEATQLVARLALAKARAVGAQLAGALVIGCDQVATLDGRLLGKPIDERNNVQQLLDASGRWVHFHTGLCLLNCNTGNAQVDVISCSVLFRPLTAAQARTYVRRERPLDCAGGFKCEGLGIALFQRLQANDPTALIGLPLIRLTEMLAHEGIDPLAGHGHAHSGRESAG